MYPRPATVFLCVTVVVACGSADRDATQTHRSTRSELAPAQRPVLDALARADARIAALAAPRDGAFTRTAAGLVNRAARETLRGGTAGVAAWWPARSASARQVGVGRADTYRLRLTERGTRNVAGFVDRGRLVYENSYTATDTVVLTNSRTVEQVWVLRDGRAPTRFTWDVELGSALGEPDPDGGGGVLWRSRSGRALLRTPAPYAIDADGVRHEAQLDWSSDTRQLSVALDHLALPHPVVLDPSFDAFPVWRQVMPASSPPPRAGHAMGYDPVRKQLLMFGGYGCDGGSCALRNDTWQWDGTTWTELADTSPSARTHVAMAYDPVLGGLNQLGGDYITSPSNESRLWDGTTWNVIDNMPALLFSRSGVALTYQPGSPGRMVSFGGDQISTTIFDPFTGFRTDGGNWGYPTLPAQPPARRDGKLIHDPATGTTYLFGGKACHVMSSCAHIDEYWELLGNAWTDRGAGMRASARSGFGAVYDSTRSVAVLFGGRDGTANLGDTWELAFPDTWTELNIAGPSARGYHAMAYDSDREVVVLFGGVSDLSDPSDTTSLLDDTWELTVADITCTDGSDCASGNCVDGVCCESATCGLCETCARPDAPGRCVSVKDGPDPDSCIGMCNENGACNDPIECADDTDCAGPCERCDMRRCVSREGEAVTECAPFLCDQDPECPQSCDDNDGCTDGLVCVDGACTDTGTSCSDAGDCDTGFCVDGVCCDQACDVCGVCSEASGATADGQCTPAAAGSADPACDLGCDGDEPKCAPAASGAGENCTEHTQCASGSCVNNECCGDTPRECLALDAQSESTAYVYEPGSPADCACRGARPVSSTTPWWALTLGLLGLLGLRRRR